MYYDEDALMDKLDEWKDQDRRNRFIGRMKHKLNAKERQYNR